MVIGKSTRKRNEEIYNTEKCEGPQGKTMFNDNNIYQQTGNYLFLRCIKLTLYTVFDVRHYSGKTSP